MSGTRSVNHPARLPAALIGVVFLLVGVLGFVPGVTSDHDRLAFAGHHSGALLLGVFLVSVLHNLVHLASGVAGLVLARTGPGALTFLLVGGAVYLALGLYGLVVDFGGSADFPPVNFLPVNAADNWLHLAVGVVMATTGLVTRVIGHRPILSSR